MTARFTAALAASTVLAACSPASSGSIDQAALDTDDQKASYAIGLNMGRQLADAASRLDVEAYARGVQDAMNASDPAIPLEELDPILQSFGQQIQAEAATERARVATENAEAGAAFQAENGAREGVTTTESGLQYEVLEEGTGPQLQPDQRIMVFYQGTLPDGREFDGNMGGEPAEFSTAEGALIPGFTEALLLMRVGSRYRIVVPSEIAYGTQDRGPLIGPNSTLIFELEVVEIVE